MSDDDGHTLCTCGRRASECAGCNPPPLVQMGWAPPAHGCAQDRLMMTAAARQAEMAEHMGYDTNTGRIVLRHTALHPEVSLAIRTAVAETVREMMAFLPDDADRQVFAEVADRIVTTDPEEWGVCPLCDEVDNTGCALAPVWNGVTR